MEGVLAGSLAKQMLQEAVQDVAVKRSLAASISHEAVPQNLSLEGVQDFVAQYSQRRAASGFLSRWTSADALLSWNSDEDGALQS